MKYSVLPTLIAVFSTAALLAQTPPPNDYPAEIRMLVQSEFDYLAHAERKIRIELNAATPETALDQIGKQAKISIVIQGRLPREPKLTRSFSMTTLREILSWYAAEVPVVFKVDALGQLTVVSPGSGIEKKTVGS